ncbi:glycoside hydrolase family 28 protein [Pseudomaricurvus alcaniphilus]|uniref:glycoside hydrolase family 28 protein n=1 Tax=Pseudomaricurvus alcaniphilus TaxID=1166482 RepID=UPI0031335174
MLHPGAIIAAAMPQLKIQEYYRVGNSNIQISRRRFTQLVGMGALGSAVGATLSGCANQYDNTSVLALEGEKRWLSADEIKVATREPYFPERYLLVEDFGAAGDNQTDCSAAISAAIRACHESGGGRVVLSSGVYRSGPVHLLSNVELHITSSAQLSFYTDPSRYLPAVFTRWEGMEMMGYSPLIYAYRQHNVAVTGGGVLNGNANRDTWWPWKGQHSERDWNYYPEQDQAAARQQLFDMAERGVPVAERVFAEGSYLRPSFIQFYECQRVKIEGVTVTAAPFWLLHPVLCEDVTVRKVILRSHGPNSDGCDPESCNRVVIEGCTFDTGDDCIAIKSGRNNDGRRLAKPCKNVLIQDCTMRAGHGGIVLGSEISGGVKNLHARNCIMSSPDLERAIRIKTNASRGGVIEHIRYENILVGEVQDAIVVNFYYEEGPNGNFQPTVKDVEIRGFYVRKAQRAFVLRGFPDNPLTGLSLRDCDIALADSLGVIENVTAIQLQKVSVNGSQLQAAQLL